jgi:hypothetical protein
MTESHTKRTFHSQLAINPKVRVESTRLPPIEQMTPQVVSSLNNKQRAELLGRLIDYLKKI